MSITRGVGGFYGWVRLLSGEIAYIHHTNYAMPDFGLAYGSNVSAGINAQFMMSLRNEVKTPKSGDYVCLILGPSTRYSGKLEGAPWFTCSYTLYRCINIIKNGPDSKMSYASLYIGNRYKRIADTINPAMKILYRILIDFFLIRCCSNVRESENGVPIQ